MADSRQTVTAKDRPLKSEEPPVSTIKGLPIARDGCASPAFVSLPRPLRYRTITADNSTKRNRVIQ